MKGAACHAPHRAKSSLDAPVGVAVLPLVKQNYQMVLFDIKPIQIITGDFARPV